MASSTSRFIQLNEYTLVEYRYTEPIIPETFSYDITKIINGHDSNTTQILNTDAEDGITNNVQERSCIKTAPGKYTDLDKDQIPTYLAYDTDLTTLTITTSNVPYDCIKFHFLSGFNFEGIDGVILKVEATERTGALLTLASIAFLKSSDFYEMNAKPIFLGDRLYDRYVFVKIPSLKQINDEFYSLEGSPSQALTLVAQMTSTGDGFLRANPLHVSAIEIASTTPTMVSAAEYDVYNIGVSKTVSFNQYDEFSLLSAHIAESTEGDFFEYFAEYAGGFIEDYILAANSMPGNAYIVIHEIRVLEQVGSTLTETFSLQSVQETNFDKPIYFRPIILNAAYAISFTIEYTTRLFNKLDSSQIIRVGSLTSYEPKKYGRVIDRIAIRDEPQSYKIYNKILAGPTISGLSFTQNAAQVVPFTTRYVPSFFERTTITVSKDNVFLDKDGLVKPDTAPPVTIVYGQGEANINITPFDNFYRFTVMQTDGTQPPHPVDLGMNAKFYLVFIGDSGNKTRILAQVDALGDPAKGQLLFKLSEADASDILTFTDREFWIVSRFADGVETSMYQGTFNKPKEILAAKAAEAALVAPQLEAAALAEATVNAANVTVETPTAPGVSPTVTTGPAITNSVNAITSAITAGKATGMKGTMTAAIGATDLTEIPGFPSDLPGIKKSVVAKVMPISVQKTLAKTKITTPLANNASTTGSTTGNSGNNGGGGGGGGHSTSFTQ